MNVMERLNGSAAGEVFRFFGEICRIPHGSGNVGAISAYLADFAKERGLTCVQDPVNNIIIIKEAAAGYEEEEPLLLQGHMDMVAVKKPGCPKDMRTEGLDLALDGDWLYAEGNAEPKRGDIVITIDGICDNARARRRRYRSGLYARAAGFGPDPASQARGGDHGG